MTLEDREITVVGYWNGDQVSPEITSTPKEGYKLVCIKIIEIFENRDITANISEVNKVSRDLKREAQKIKKGSIEIKKATDKVDKVNKSLKKVSNILKKLK